MKKLLLLLLTIGVGFAANATDEIDYTAKFKLGTPEIQSINALAFGPEGILFIGDSKSAKVFAVETADKKMASSSTISMAKIDVAIAKALGTDVDKISILDMVINPLSKNAYFAIEHSDGTPILLKLSNGKFENVSLASIKYDETAIQNALVEDATDGRGRSQRVWTVSDLNYYDGKVMVSGLSNKEFSSTFRSIPFPFSGQQNDASLEIYHASHGRYETYAPIKSFTASEVGGKPMLIASYTCTPLVVFPLEQLKPGEHVKGRTVAELGNRNTPLDMIVLEKDGEKYLLMANSSRSAMKIKFSDIEKFDGTLTSPVEDTAGVEFVALPYGSVQQMDKLNEASIVMIQKDDNGDLNLVTQSI